MHSSHRTLTPPAARPARAATSRLLAALTLTLVAASIAPPHARAQSIVVFGDSLSDTGNVLALSSSPQGALLGFTPRPTAPTYFTGQFTNGPGGNAGLTPTVYTQGNWVNVLADRLGRPRPIAAGLAADIAPLGTNYAWGGALASEPSLLPAAAVQVDLFIAGRTRVPSNNIYTFWLGSNDVINAASATGATPASVAAAGSAALAAVRSSIQTLVTTLDPTAPASILWANLPALDRTPLALTLPAQLRAAVAQASADFRTAQAQAIAQLRAANPALNLVALDTFSLFSQLLDSPNSFSITNTTTPILANADFLQPGPFLPTLNVPANTNPDSYVFWDSLHPTARVHALIGEAAAAVIPAPSTTGAFVLLTLHAARRRRTTRTSATRTASTHTSLA